MHTLRRAPLPRSTAGPPPTCWGMYCRCVLSRGVKIRTTLTRHLNHRPAIPPIADSSCIYV